ncbi:MAG: gfo/Idh/MocA family oxidoreductase, partial [Rhodoglobus sp.]
VQNLGPVRRVAAQSSTSHQTRTVGSGSRAGEAFPVEVPTHFGALLEFENSASAQCIFSFQSGLSRSGLLEISGTLGTIALPDPNGFDGDVSVFDVGSDEPDLLVTTSNFGRGAGVVDLARSIRAGVPEQASAEQAFHVLDTMVAITEAAASGDYVAVSSSTPALPALPAEWNPREATL